MFEVERQSEEIYDLMNWAQEGIDQGTRYPGMSYEQGILDALCCNAHQSGAVLNIGNQLIPRPDRKVFNCCFIHWPLPPQEEQGLVFLNSPQFRHTLLYLLP